MKRLGVNNLILIVMVLVANALLVWGSIAYAVKFVNAGHGPMSQIATLTIRHTLPFLLIPGLGGWFLLHRTEEQLVPIARLTTFIALATWLTVMTIMSLDYQGVFK